MLGGGSGRRQVKLNGATVLACILKIEEVIAIYQTAMNVYVGKPELGSTDDLSGRPTAAASAGPATSTAIGKHMYPTLPKTPLPQPDPYRDTFVVHVVTGCNLLGEVSRFQTISLPPDIDWLDFARALSDTTANTWQAVEAGFPCGYEVSYDDSSHSGNDNGNGDDDRDDDDDDEKGQRCFWLWIYKGARQQVGLRTPYRRLSSREEYKELQDVYCWEKTLERTRGWQGQGQGQGFMEGMLGGLVVLHVCFYSPSSSSSSSSSSHLYRKANCFGRPLRYVLCIDHHA